MISHAEYHISAGSFFKSLRKKDKRALLYVQRWSRAGLVIHFLGKVKRETSRSFEKCNCSQEITALKIVLSHRSLANRINNDKNPKH